MTREPDVIVKDGPEIERSTPPEPEASRQHDAAYIRGRVDCGVGLDGADIRVLDADGTLLNAPPPHQSALSTSGPTGTFVVGVTRVPERFRIVAHDAHCGDWVTDFKLDVHGFDPARHFASITPVSTLLAAYADRGPGMDPERAQADVKRFLGIADSVDLYDTDDMAGAFFHGVAFLEEAERAGGIEPLLESLLEEMTADPSATHSFTDLALAGPGDAYELGGGMSAAGGWIAKQLAGGAISYAGGQALGWVLHNLNLDIFPDPVGEKLAQVQRALDEIKDGITHLGSQLNRTCDLLREEIDQTDYDVRVGQLVPLNSTISRASIDLARLAENAAAVGERARDDPWIAQERVRLEGVMAGLLDDVEMIHDQQVGTGGAKGLIEVWSRIVAGRHRFVDPEASDMIRRQFDFFDALQLSLLNLTLEYRHLTGAPESTIKELVSTYQENRELQLKMLPRRVPVGTVVERRSKLMIACDTLHDGLAPQDLRSLFRDRVAAYNSGGNHGPLKEFDDWRMPTKEDVEHVFEDWQGASVAAWAISEAYPASEADTKRYLWEDARIFAAKPFYTSWLFSLKDGSLQENRCKKQYMRNANWRTQWCYSPSSLLANGGVQGYLLPVRDLGPEEIYFY